MKAPKLIRRGMSIHRLKEGGFEVEARYLTRKGKEKIVTFKKQDRDTPISKLAGITKADRDRADAEAGA